MYWRNTSVTDQTDYTMRYNFAMCSFSRMYGVNSIRDSHEVSKFCKKWAESEGQNVPLGTLTEVDFYFRDLWKIWGGYL